ncbi:hypothetical protein [Salsuginibacillus kocurii]|uniref:hypothetical protein n=1 Tax=Salsuginibacillus kocurii TaxID=427078 RepID=UPI00035F5409|nr:hypothetical protein [Salsuginibacillus kocurii]
MEELLQFLFANIFWIILLLGGLFSVFNRQSGNQERQSGEQQRRTSNQPQSQDGNRREPVDWRELMREVQGKESDDHPTSRAPERGSPINSSPREAGDQSSSHEAAEAEQTSKAHQEYNEQMEQLKRKKQEAKEKLANEGGLGEAIDDSGLLKEAKSRIASSAQVDLELEKLSKDEAMKGFIWSEVFGEPRAKKPYHTGKLYNPRRRS